MCVLCGGFVIVRDVFCWCCVICDEVDLLDCVFYVVVISCLSLLVMWVVDCGWVRVCVWVVIDSSCV